ncbi:MAG: type II toxin-antitoxin system RelE/ParE family toxin [Candidatus Latescibacterota bacterium]
MHPLSGVVIEGTGGIRKLRWARKSQGKSGGLRVICFFYYEKIPLYVLTIYSKGKKDDISAEERNQLAKLVEVLVGYWERK